MTLPVIAVLTLLALAVAGCGDTTAGSDGDAAGPGAGASDSGRATAAPADGVYVATDVSGRSLVEGTRVRLTWKGDQLSADAGCNQMSGSASVADGRLVVTGLGMTEMGCEPGRMEQDEWVADLLTSRPRIATGADGFTLTGQSVTARFATEPPPEDVSLEGTTWLLESTVDGDVASSSVGGPAASTPRFRIADGRVVGFDGCDELSGPVDVTADSIAAGGDLGGTERQCLVAGAPLADLLGGSTYVVEGDRLTLTRGEISLVLRAE
ncbi:META domain-containing protein [Nocardioides sp. HDW12B]|uniref:META domain-containing protein n=1 Tax=Nocardioides sp. HDW12B TaxID=2714939 RepID=UPI0014077836|nr:META domain-containing protein [Nocardioides sp. HDW12B]QIK67187.1 META domain-containing protein [Nocardioides sp. HDW12B]